MEPWLSGKLYRSYVTWRIAPLHASAICFDAFLFDDFVMFFLCHGSYSVRCRCVTGVKPYPWPRQLRCHQRPVEPYLITITSMEFDTIWRVNRTFVIIIFGTLPGGMDTTFIHACHMNRQGKSAHTWNYRVSIKTHPREVQLHLSDASPFEKPLPHSKQQNIYIELNVQSEVDWSQVFASHCSDTLLNGCMSQCLITWWSNMWCR